MLREETRGSHWREDFPDRDDERWSGHVDATLDRGHLSLSFHAGSTERRGAHVSIPDDLRAELTAAGLDPDAVHAAVLAALEEDLPDGGVDVTSDATIAADARGVADFGAREPGIVAGLGVAALVFATVMGDDVEITDRLPDGTASAPVTW